MKTPSYVIGYICAFILLLAITSPATETRRQNYTGKKDVISTASGQVTAMRTIAMGAKQAPIFTILFNDTSATQTVTGAGQLAPWSATTLDKNLPGLTPVQIYWNGRKPALFFLSPDVNRMFLTEDLGQPTSTILLPCAPPVQNDFQPLPDDLKKLAFLSVIFLDGEQAAQLTPKQIETIEQWIALGGVLCLDPQSLNALQ